MTTARPTVAEAVAVRADLDPAERRAALEALTAADAPELLDYEPDALYPSPRLPAPLSPGERVVAVALVPLWLTAATGWAAVAGVAELIRWARR